MRSAALGGIALGLAAFNTTGNAVAASTPTGLEIGLRSGYSLPFGNTTGAPSGATAPNLSDLVKGVVPIEVDLGSRFNKNMFVGVHFQYGIGILSTDNISGCNQGGVGCTVSDWTFGVDFHYHLMPDQPFDPWAGTGVGYEFLNVDVSGGADSGTSLNGVQFFNVQLGVDSKEVSNFGIGPFVMFSLDQFSYCSASESGLPVAGGGSCSIPNTALHEWFTIGIRGAYDVNLKAAAASKTAPQTVPIE